MGLDPIDRQRLRFRKPNEMRLRNMGRHRDHARQVERSHIHTCKGSKRSTSVRLQDRQYRHNESCSCSSKEPGIFLSPSADSGPLSCWVNTPCQLSQKTQLRQKRRKMAQFAHPLPGREVMAMARMMLTAPVPVWRLFFFFVCDVLVRFQRPASKALWTWSVAHPLLARTVFTHNTLAFRSNIFLCQSGVLWSLGVPRCRALTRQWFSELRLIAQPLDTLAADRHCIVRVYTPRRNRHTLHPSAHCFVFGCIDVSRPSTHSRGIFGRMSGEWGHCCLRKGRHASRTWIARGGSFEACTRGNSVRCLDAYPHQELAVCLIDTCSLQKRLRSPRRFPVSRRQSLWHHVTN